MVQMMCFWMELNGHSIREISPRGKRPYVTAQWGCQKTRSAMQQLSAPSDVLLSRNRDLSLSEFILKTTNWGSQTAR